VSNPAAHRGQIVVPESAAALVGEAKAPAGKAK
jgi:hypothetical protein